MTVVTKLSLGTRPGTWHLSLPFQNENGLLGPYILAGQNEVVLIDPGPGITVPALLASLKEVGFEPRDVTHLLLTHIHLDHAGATGELLRRMPKARTPWEMVPSIPERLRYFSQNSAPF